MRLSWVQGVFMFYLLIFGLEVMLTGGVSLGATTSSGIENAATNNQTTLMQPEFATSANIITGAWTIVKNIVGFLGILVKVLALWAPTVFGGDMIWVWWYICFPTDVAMVFAILSLARGVNSA